MKRGKETKLWETGRVVSKKPCNVCHGIVFPKVLKKVVSTLPLMKVLLKATNLSSVQS
jgi:hypothetical protein